MTTDTWNPGPYEPCPKCGTSVTIMAVGFLGKTNAPFERGSTPGNIRYHSPTRCKVAIRKPG